MYFFQILTCIFIAGLTLYANIRQHNKLTAIQLLIPKIEREVKLLKKENEKLQFEIDRFESPIHLMERMREPPFGHLKFPNGEDVIILEGDGSA